MTFAAVLISMVTAACGQAAAPGPGTGSPAASTPSIPVSASAAPKSAGAPNGGLDVMEVPPTATDPILVSPSSPDIVVTDSAVPSNGELLVFFPGTGGSPGCCTFFLQSAAELGFHTIGLTYENSRAVGAICLNDLACFGTVRQDDFDGSAPNRFIAVPPAQSIQSRLADVLAYLETHDSSTGWNQFLTGTNPDWSKIVVSGHSQGGGDAAYIAKIRPVEGVVMLSSVVDSSVTTPYQPATYLTSGHLTPLARYIAFDHRADPFYPKITADWTALNLPSMGGVKSVDGMTAPFGDTHELATSTGELPGPVQFNTHDSTAVDIQTPLCPNGSAAFASVWQYMMEVAGGLHLTAGSPVCTRPGAP